MNKLNVCMVNSEFRPSSSISKINNIQEIIKIFLYYEIYFNNEFFILSR